MVTKTVAIYVFFDDILKSMDCKAVILIVTKKQIQDMLGVAIQNVSTFRRFYSNTSVVAMNWKKGIFNANLNYITNSTFAGGLKRTCES